MSRWFFSQVLHTHTSRARNLSCWGWYAKSPRVRGVFKRSQSELWPWRVVWFNPYQWPNSWSVVFNFDTTRSSSKSQLHCRHLPVLFGRFRMVGEALQRFWLLMFSRSSLFASRRCDILNLLVGCLTPNICCGRMSLPTAWLKDADTKATGCQQLSAPLRTFAILLSNSPPALPYLRTSFSMSAMGFLVTEGFQWQLDSATKYCSKYWFCLWHPPLKFPKPNQLI